MRESTTVRGARGVDSVQQRLPAPVDVARCRRGRAEPVEGPVPATTSAAAAHDGPLLLVGSDDGSAEEEEEGGGGGNNGSEGKGVQVGEF